ncbi:MAG: quinone-dependent dihydroorotate dehydrogenase [Deltaproteobacteria bacterium]|nr:quinone-dependent dihydroorotate dehydrogenase [Deltaproteobacteria bacterium]
MCTFINWLWKLVRRILFCFDAEKTHTLAIYFMRCACVLPNPKQEPLAYLPKVFEIPFLSRLGLAAGFDKNAEILTMLPKLGFGFVEIGTVTERPQLGNPKPRLFRDFNQKALFNQMGFNNDGALVIAKRVEKARNRLPSTFRIGVNVGINKGISDTKEIISNYIGALAPFRTLADYFVVNISSPNTPGLRSLQNMEKLKPILSELLHLVYSWEKTVPLLIKLSPEINDKELIEIITESETLGIDGFVLCNTLLSKMNIHEEEKQGGLSGAPLTKLSRECLKAARRITKLPIISVGGIFSNEESALRLRLGADLIQIYTGWIFRGPAFPFGIKN